MQKLFVDFIPNGTFTLDEEQSRHIAKSLRMRKGDMLTLSAQNGKGYDCIIESVNDKNVVMSLCYEQADTSEPTVKVTLYQGVPKGGKLEDIIQKCTELGVTAIQPVLTHRSVSRPDAKSAERKLVRYKKIALEAAQQSGRGIVPEINMMTDLKNAVLQDKSELKILFYEGGGIPLREAIKNSVGSVSIYIGPEGGFESGEVELIKSAGGVTATLGKRILRTQTAPVAALSAIMLITGNLE